MALFSSVRATIQASAAGFHLLNSIHLDRDLVPNFQPRSIRNTPQIRSAFLQLSAR